MKPPLSQFRIRLRAAMTMGAAAAGSGKREEARELLVRSMTDSPRGSDTPVLKEAKALTEGWRL